MIKLEELYNLLTEFDYELILKPTKSKNGICFNRPLKLKEELNPLYSNLVIAGISNLPYTINEEWFEVGMELKVLQEETNKNDKYALSLIHPSGHKVGYLPKHKCFDNPYKPLVAIVKNFKTRKSGWVQVWIDIYENL